MLGLREVLLSFSVRCFNNLLELCIKLSLFPREPKPTKRRLLHGLNQSNSESFRYSLVGFDGEINMDDAHRLPLVFHDTCKRCYPRALFF